MENVPEVLIFSSSEDAHAAAIRWALSENNVNVALTPSVRFDGGGVRVWIDAESTRADGSLSPSQFRNLRSVWNRRPKVPGAGTCHESDREFIAGQWRYFQNNIFSLSDRLLDALWVNRPVDSVRAENKMVQLQAAREVGLSFPELVVTNDVRDVKMMLERWPKLVFKTFYPHNWRSEATGKVFSISVKLLDRDSELPEEAIALSPGIFQRYIEKAYDVRVTIIGDRFFSVQMRQNDGVAYVDWRDHMEDEDMLMEVVSIPAPIEDKLRALMKRLGLVYGCIDLVVDREGNVYFLEVNQAGQFLFLEEALPGLPLMRAMTAMLASGCVNYSLEDGGRFNFSDFLSTDDYQEVIRTQIRSVMPNQSRAVEA